MVTAGLSVEAPPPELPVENLLAGEVDTLSRREYGVSAEENERLGLPCGGRLEILVEPMGVKDQTVLRELLTAVAERRYLARRVDLGTGVSTLESASGYAPLAIDDSSLLQTFGPRYRMLLIGAGALSETLSQLASAMDYQVLVNDPREDVLARWEGEAVLRIPGMPDDAVREHAADRHSIVLTLTHDPRIDDMALMEALEHELFYIGALGSVRTTEKRVERLK